MEGQQIITVTPDQLQLMIDAGVTRAIDRVVPKLASYIREADRAKEYQDELNIDQAIEFLSTRGCVLTRPAIYQRTHKGTIPHGHIGNRKLVFSRKKLTEWLESQIKEELSSVEATEESGRLISEQVSKRKSNRT